MSDYAYQTYLHREKPFGEFNCLGCRFTFVKADETHGGSGFCVQCEIARGLFKLHGNDDAANKLEQERTKAVLDPFVAAVPFGHLL